MKRNIYKAEVNNVVYPNLILAATSVGVKPGTLQHAARIRYSKTKEESFEVKVKNIMFTITVYPV